MGALAAILVGFCAALIWPKTSSGTSLTLRQAGDSNLLPLVDPLIGTLGDGNTTPAASAPFGMMQWGSDTSAGGLSRPGGYNDGDPIIRDFSLTHFSGAGCAAMLNVPFMPTTRPITSPPRSNGSPYSTRFRHAQETARPGSYAVQLSSGIRVQIAVTPRTGIAAITYPQRSSANLLINPGSAAGVANTSGAFYSSIAIQGNNLVTGSATAGRFCNLGNHYTLYFAAQFSRPFARSGTWLDRGMHAGGRAAAGRHCGAFLSFKLSSGRTVSVKVALSFVSVSGAFANLQAENAGWSLAAVQHRTETAWNSVLNRIVVTGGTLARRRAFYTALYHAALHPNVFSDDDGRYIGFDGHIHTARGYTQYANFSGWDIYRTQVPLIAWLLPRQSSDMMQSLVADGRQSGWLPKWPVANMETGEMDGDSADPILAGAFAFGAHGFDTRLALQLMDHGASVPGWGAQYFERPDLAQYLRSGFAVQQTGGWGPAAETLEYALDDYAIGRLARAVGDQAPAARYLRRSHNWQTLFNRATGFLEPRDVDGSFPYVFNPAAMTGFVEGNAYQYLWTAPQDARRLIHLAGGNVHAIARLNSLFRQLNAGPLAPYYWAGNEPGLWTPWFYNAAGAPWRTQQVVNRILTTLYSDSPRGLPGNDDLGTMSAWSVWASIGLFPQIPGVAGVTLGSPQFPQITIHPGSGAPVHISAAGAPGKIYIQDLTLNGRPYQSTWLPLAALKNRAELHFGMAHGPNTHWGIR